MPKKYRYMQLDDEEAELIFLAQELGLSKLLEWVHLLKEKGIGLEQAVSSLKEGKPLPGLEELKNQIAEKSFEIGKKGSTPSS